MSQFESLGQAWVSLVDQTIQQGERLSDEGCELRNVVVSFPTDFERDALIDQFGDAKMIGEIRGVFSSDGSSALGHSYAKLMRGPHGRNDLSDVIDLLRAERWSKRAVVAFCGSGDGQVPCINAVQFLVRNGRVEASYFARGQDAFRKFYADGLCLAAMVRRVAGGLGVSSGRMTGFVASSHVYHVDMPAAKQFLDAAASNAVAARQYGAG
jgi:thymidylate synthase